MIAFESFSPDTTRLIVVSAKPRKLQLGIQSEERAEPRAKPKADHICWVCHYTTTVRHLIAPMSNPFGGFTVTSPLSSISHNSLHDLSSNCVRDYFGPTCQTVFASLLSKGPSTLSQLIIKIRLQCKRDINSERLRLVQNLEPLSKGRTRAKLNLARGSEEKGYIVDSSAVRAALIVLQQHSLVRAVPPTKSGGDTVNEHGKNIKYTYVVDTDRAILIQRYPRYVEYARKTYNEEGGAIIEEMLVHGRMGTVEVIKASVECVGRYLSADGDDEVSVSDGEKLALAQKVVDALALMVEDGCVELVLPIGHSSSQNNEDGEESGFGFGGISTIAVKQEDGKLDADVNDDELVDGGDGIDAGLRSILNAPRYQRTFIQGAVWRANTKMFHASLRAFYMGRLVAERYAHVQFAGAIVSAAMKYTTAKEFSSKYKPMHATQEERERALEEKTVFTPNDIMDFLPPTVLAELKNKAGGARSNLSAILATLAGFVYPAVVEEVEEANGHPEGGKFEIATRQLLSYLKGRITHQVVRDHYGDVGARICSILEAKGHLEGDAVAEGAMVPAKDAREMLHQLYKANYISMLYLQQTKQHNPANAMYLWCVDKKRMHHTILMNVSGALFNMRLRRQHEVQVGKDWIDRAKLAGDTDENESEMDKINYNKFCQGLERIDNACLQLDETLMILKEFGG